MFGEIIARIKPVDDGYLQYIWTTDINAYRIILDTSFL